MNRDPEILEKIELYLAGHLPADEADAFKQLSEHNAEITELIEEKKAADLYIIANRLSDVKLMMDKDFEEGKVGNYGQNNNSKWWITGACLLLTASAIFYFNLKSSDTILADRDQPGKARQKNLPEKFMSEENTNQIADERINKFYPKAPQLHSMKKGIFTSDSIAETIYSESTIDKKSVLSEEEIISPPDLKITNYPAPVSPTVEKNDPVGINTENVISLPTPSETTIIEESENTFSFKPEYGEVFQIPMTKGSEAQVLITDRAGNTVYSEKIFNTQINTWDGTSSRGGISPPGLYLYRIEYADGHKKSGQIIIY